MTAGLPASLAPLGLFIARHPRAVALVAWALLAVLLAADAEARVGGGQRSSRPSSGSSSGGSSGGGGEIELLFFLIRLAIEVPVVGVPLLVIVVSWLVYSAYRNHSANDRVVAKSRSERRTAGRGRSASIPGIGLLRKADAGFSMPVFIDFAVLIHRRALEATASGDRAPLAPFVSDEAFEQLRRALTGVRAIEDVVTGGARVTRISRDGDDFRAEVVFENTRTEQLQAGPRDVVVHERWTFHRAASAQTQAPSDVERLGCPSCGAAIDVDPLGACRNCQTHITAGQLQWQVASVEVGSRQPAVAPEVGFFQGGDESSVHVPVVQSPSVQAEARKLLARHPELSLEAFAQRVALIFHRLQEAWSAGKWEQARPYVTDAQFQSLRFWMDRYRKHRLQNRLEDIELELTSIVKIEVDAWFEAITVRVVASMKDSVIDLKSGKVIGGNPKVSRRFAEYWTFLRSSGGDGGTRGDSAGCPSCGAPLDNVSQAGVCGYCDTKITTGRFDWVLSRIEQPESYSG